jgi:hypothetical protein
MCYIYTKRYYSAIKKKEIVPFAGKWMELKIITLNETGQTLKAKLYAESGSKMTQITIIMGLEWKRDTVGRCYERG